MTLKKILMMGFAPFCVLGFACDDGCSKHSHGAEQSANAVQTADLAPENIAAHLQSCCVTLKAGSAEGSGTIFLRSVEGQSVVFILTAHHVVEGLRRTKKVINDKGDSKTQISYGDAHVVQEWLDQETGERVGETKVLSKILTVDAKRDIALLEVKAKGWKNVSMQFSQEEKFIGAGTAIIHCGSPGGQSMGAGSVLFGNVARVGCRIPEFGPFPFDQLACPALGGSSGGMVVRRTGSEAGRWVGMITLGLRGADSFHWMVPIRVLRDWAEEVDVEWLLADDGKTTRDDINKIPLENSKTGFDRNSKYSAPSFVPPHPGEPSRPEYHRLIRGSLKPPC